MMLSDVLDFLESLGLAEHVYMAKLDAKKEQSIGVYNSKHKQADKMALGGSHLQSYGVKRVTFLVHWSKSPRETEKAAYALFEALRQTRNVTINSSKIKFIQMLSDSPVDVGTDDAGICEMVVEAAVIYEKGEANVETDRGISRI